MKSPTGSSPNPVSKAVRMPSRRAADADVGGRASDVGGKTLDVRKRRADVVAVEVDRRAAHVKRVVLAWRVAHRQLFVIDGSVKRQPVVGLLVVSLTHV